MLTKIISGGQTGVDVAGLDAGLACGLRVGGTMPKDYRTLEGTKPEYAIMYGMKEHQSAEYPPRTLENAKNSDATIWIGQNPNSRGMKCTFNGINKYKKKSLKVDMSNPLTAEEVAKWIVDNNISVLNVAGEAEQNQKGIYKFALEYLKKVFNLVHQIEKNM